ncbi:MAG: hypothetical protein WD270_07470, partial [Acetobacterales bacterium]
GRRDPDKSIVTLFETPNHRPPTELRGFAGDLERIAHSHTDLTNLDAIRDYFGEVYWRKGTKALDRDGVLEKFRADASGTDFAFREVGEAFRLIEEGMVPVIVRRDEASRNAVRALTYAEKTGGLARRLQPYIVQIPPKIRAELVRFGQVTFAAAERLGDQFAVLESEDLYDDDVGLVWERAGLLAAENSIF